MTVEVLHVKALPFAELAKAAGASYMDEAATSGLRPAQISADLERMSDETIISRVTPRARKAHLFDHETLIWDYLSDALGSKKIVEDPFGQHAEIRGVDLMELEARAKQVSKGNLDSSLVTDQSPLYGGLPDLLTLRSVLKNRETKKKMARPLKVVSRANRANEKVLVLFLG